MKTPTPISKQERIQLVLEGVLPAEYITQEELLEVLDTLQELILERHTTHEAPENLQ